MGGVESHSVVGGCGDWATVQDGMGRVIAAVGTAGMGFPAAERVSGQRRARADVLRNPRASVCGAAGRRPGRAGPPF